jgi:hypothetical protein
MSGHTPGPWEYSHRNWRGQASERRWFVTGDHHDDEDGEPVCTAVCQVERNPTSWPVCENNARLIAAAPCLLAACKEAADWLNRRAAHYQELGSHDVAAGLAYRAEVLLKAVARAEGGSSGAPTRG